MLLFSGIVYIYAIYLILVLLDEILFLKFDSLVNLQRVIHTIDNLRSVHIGIDKSFNYLRTDNSHFSKWLIWQRLVGNTFFKAIWKFDSFIRRSFYGWTELVQL